MSKSEDIKKEKTYQPENTGSSKWDSPVRPRHWKSKGWWNAVQSKIWRFL